MKRSLWNDIARFLSFCCIGVAAATLIAVCAYCYPEVELCGRTVFFGAENSPAREAFSVLTESLEKGNTVRDSILRSYEVLIDSED